MNLWGTRGTRLRVGAFVVEIRVEVPARRRSRPWNWPAD